MTAAIHELSQGAEKQLCLERLWENVHSYGGRFTCSIAFFLAKALSSEDTLREEEQLFVSVFKSEYQEGKREGKFGIQMLVVLLTRKFYTGIPASRCSSRTVGHHQPALAQVKKHAVESTILDVCFPAAHLAVLLALLCAKSALQGHGEILREKKPTVTSYGGKGSVLTLALVLYMCCYR